jgi:hypothetical protein
VSWLEFAADIYLDQRHRNWVLSEESGDVVFVPARGVVLVHRERAEHVAAALGAAAEIAALPQQPVPLPAPDPVRLIPARAPELPPLAADAGISRSVLGWLGIVAGAAVFVAALAVPLDDPALVMALVIGVRGGRLILDVDS